MSIPMLGETTFDLALALAFLVLGGLLLLGFYFLVRQGLKPDLRPLGGYEAMLDQVGQAVESGGRVHVSLGPNSIVSEDTGVALAGLAMLDLISRASAISDRTPVATTADATTLLVMGDTIQRAYQENARADRYETTTARLVALDPVALAAGGTSIIADDQVRANVLVASFGMEAALMAEAGQRKGIPQVIASDRVEAQATGITMADHVLIGEEMFVARAYLEQDPPTTASALTQDILRWFVIGAIFIGVVMQTLGLLR